MNWARGAWQKALEQTKAEDETVLKFDPRVVEMMTKSLNTQFPEWVEQMRDKPFSLTHGDFHPANFMVVRPRDSSESNNDDKENAAASTPFSLVMLDFEVIGVGSGAQDLGQFMISHPNRADRKRMEAVVLPAYAERLAKRVSEKAAAGAGVKAPSLEEIKAEYAVGGMGRWVWLFAILCGMCPAPMVHYFHKQVLEFAEDHGLFGQDILPRP